MTISSLLLFFLGPVTLAYPPWRSSSGCGIDHTSLAGANSTVLSIESSGGDREFLVHIPSNYDAREPTGLIFSYHGNSRTMYYQESLSQFSDEQYNPDWIAVYPQGINNSWQGPSYAVPGVNDLAFTTDLIAYMSDNFCIDRSRTYATGKSNGAGFVGTLACAEEGGTFAAFAPVSGAFYTDNPQTYESCSPAQPKIPILEFHGGNDTTIPYSGGTGRGGELPDIDEWLGWWAERDDCSGKAVVQEEDEQVQHTVYDCGQGKDGLVQGYKIAGLGHDWPSLTPNLDNDEGTLIEATAVIMEFFRRWPL